MPKFCACGSATLYGKPGGSAVVCAQCVTDTTMINLRVNNCEFDGCRVCASYGPASDPSRHGYRCATHKKPTDILKTGQTCEVCGISASYGTKRPIHCGTHKLAGEHRIFRAALCGCGSIAYWRVPFTDGMPGKAKRATHCTKCRLPNMESTTRRNSCIIEGCGKYRLFIKSVSNDFCPMHTEDQPTLQCISWPCDKLIISTYDKCRKHRSRTFQEAYNPCKMNDKKMNDKKITDQKITDQKIIDQKITADKKTLDSQPPKPQSLKKILSSWLNDDMYK